MQTSRKRSRDRALSADKDRKQRGRSVISHPIGPSPTHPAVPQTQMTQVNRAVTASGNMGKHRGDRRDMSKTYTNNEPHAARGNTPRKDVSTRRR